MGLNARFIPASMAGICIVLSGCMATAPTLGDKGAKTTVTGATGGANAVQANSAIERCERPFGTVALVEEQHSAWYQTLREHKLGSTVPVIRLMVQQSNCFIVVERGRAMSHMNAERQLEQSGELRAQSQFGKGQMVAADYAISPEIIFDQKGTQGLGGALGGWAGMIAGSVRKNEASTVLLLTDNRSGVQVSASEGSASNMDYRLFGGLFGGGMGAMGGGYTNTPQGKVIAAAFVDAYNQMVKSLHSYQAQSMGDRGLGTGGRLGVEGSPQPARAPAQ
jgi:curli biogenesis system outer membrane secretion channel CsgG